MVVVQGDGAVEVEEVAGNGCQSHFGRNEPAAAEGDYLRELGQVLSCPNAHRYLCRTRVQPCVFEGAKRLHEEVKKSNNMEHKEMPAYRWPSEMTEHHLLPQIYAGLPHHVAEKTQDHTP